MKAVGRSGGRAVGLIAAVAVVAAACQQNARGSGPGEFDGAQAFRYVEQQMAFGPRIPNTPGHVRTGDWLEAELRQRADSVVVQAFVHRTARGDTLRLRNFFARFLPSATDRVLLLAHWDTRPRADKSSNLGQQRLPVPGANDGASGVAVLLGVGDAIKGKAAGGPGAPAYGVDLLFVDGEDYGDFSDSTETLIGSRYFATHLPDGYAPLFAVVFDMVGDKDLQMLQEGNSVSFAPEVVQRVWSTAERLGYGRVFVARVGTGVIDDHLPLQRVGIRAIDVIDLDYGPGNAYHHTTEDTIDKVSAASLKIVGDVALALVRP
jgi:glutaminyl-peptide cyclotransferase